MRLCAPNPACSGFGSALRSASGVAKPLMLSLGLKMKRSNPISEELIAPCGMNCAICSRHLSFLNNLRRSQCVGCRPRNKECIYLVGKCIGINHTARGNAAFCFECNYYPCKQIDRMDDRYRRYRLIMKRMSEKSKVIDTA
jgi:hypothetical protein